MTIRRNVNIRDLNDDYMDFEQACERAPEGTFEQSKAILFMLGTQADALLGSAAAMGLATCNCDGIREIEVMMFAMLRDKNPDSEIESAIGLGATLREADCGTMDRILAGLERDRDFLLSLKGETAEQQADGSWAIMHRGGFVKGGFYTREDCEAKIAERERDAVESVS